MELKNHNLTIIGCKENYDEILKCSEYYTEMGNFVSYFPIDINTMLDENGKLYIDANINKNPAFKLLISRINRIKRSDIIIFVPDKNCKSDADLECLYFLVLAYLENNTYVYLWDPKEMNSIKIFN